MSEEQEVKRSFQVEIDQVRTHSFIIDDVNSQEEAELVAEEWLADGEDGEIVDEEIINVDVYPVETKEDNYN
jgi:hypothetical protein